MSDLDLLRRIDAIERMLCQGHPEGVMCAICEARYSVPEPAPVPDDESPDGLVYDAWCVIANAPVPGWGFSGFPTPEGKEWIEAAKRWRDAWRETLDADPEPEPVPEWRRLVDAMPPKPFAERHPLAEILERLAVLDEYSDTGVDETRLYQMNIARIVAVCEQQVGDGWQADPDVVPRGHWGIAWLLVPLSHEPPGWTMVGNRAAAWLRDLTEGGTA
jgi:hypothetical protein